MKIAWFFGVTELGTGCVTGGRKSRQGRQLGFCCNTVECHMSLCVGSIDLVFVDLPWCGHLSLTAGLPVGEL